MREKSVQYAEKPAPFKAEVLSTSRGLMDHVTVTGPAEETEHGWTADTNDFWEQHGTLDLPAIEADPVPWLKYVDTTERARLQDTYTAAIQKWMDDTAHTRGYDNIHTAASYENSSVPKFRQEGQACRLWRDRVWVASYDYLDKVKAGLEPIVPVEELIRRLPQLEWLAE